MSEFKTKKQQEQEKEIYLVGDDLIEDLPLPVIAPPEQIVAIVKPKKLKSPYIETVLLFVCAIISIGADAFIFSSSLFSKIIADLNTGLTTFVSVLCIVVHIVPEVFWGINIYKKATRLGNYSVILTDDKIIACGKANSTECKVIKLEDLLNIYAKGSKVTIEYVNGKLKLDFINPQEFVELVQNQYNML